MKSVSAKTKKIVIVGLSIMTGFWSGFMVREFFDKPNSAHAEEAAKVTVQKVTEKEVPKFNRLISPNLWDIYLDPFFVPVQWSAHPLPVTPLMAFPLNTPRVQTIDDGKELRVIAQVPGMNQNDVKVEASERAITIKAHKKMEEKNNQKFQTIDESFEQSVSLPSKVDPDKIQATVKDGVLTVMLPKN